MSLTTKKPDSNTYRRFQNTGQPIKVALYYIDRFHGIRSGSHEDQDEQEQAARQEHVTNVVTPIWAIPFPQGVSEEDIVKTIKLSDRDKHKLFPVFAKPKDMNFRVNVVGKSGAGKSYLVGLSLAYQCHMDPKPVVLITSIAGDTAYLSDKYSLRRFDMDNPATGSLTLEQLRNSYVIFDDVDTHEDKDMLRHVKALRNAVFRRGRHLKIDVYNVGHVALGGSTTKVLLQQATHMVFFPHTQPAQMIRYFKAYEFFTPDRINQMLELASRYDMGRFLVYYNDSPPYIMTEKYIHVLS